MTLKEIRVSITYAWWFRFYIFGVMTMCHLTGLQPHNERFSYWCKKAVRIKVMGV